MKQKQKKIVMMCGLSAAAVVMLGMQVGPLVFGGSPSRKQQAATKGGGKATSKAAHAQGAKPQGKPKAGKTPQPAPGPPVEEVKIDLSGAVRKAFAYKQQDGLRSPFGLTLFELKSKDLMAPKVDVKLTGIIESGQQRLAIIEGRVYAVGDEVKKGMKVCSIEADSVAVTHGGDQVKLRLSVPDLTVGSP